MKQLVILSGKGGTGKTSVTAAFTHLAVRYSGLPFVILTDADVDAANLELVLDPVITSQEQFWGGQLAIIDQDVCTGCGDCLQVCRFNAIQIQNGNVGVDHLACEGCAACYYACPFQAVSMEPQIAGDWYRSETHYGPLLHAALLPAQENSGKLVTVVRREARFEASESNEALNLIDGPPGIGCPVISAVSGADRALIVTEPSMAGMHDLHRIIDTTRHFGVLPMVCINKADIDLAYAKRIEAECLAIGVETIGRIPFDLNVTQAMTCGQPVTAYAPNCPASQAIRTIWDRLLTQFDIQHEGEDIS